MTYKLIETTNESMKSFVGKKMELHVNPISGKTEFRNVDNPLDGFKTSVKSMEEDGCLRIFHTANSVYTFELG